MGSSASRETEVSQRLVESLELGHLHTLQLLLKFVQHAPGGAPATQIANKTSAAVAHQHLQHTISIGVDAKPRRPPPASAEVMDEATAGFHARAAALAQQQALAAGLQSASFPIPMDLDTLHLPGGDSLLIASVRKDQPSIVQLLCATGLEIDAQDFRGMTALHYAALMHRIGCTRILVGAHAFSLVHMKEGLLASQMTPHEEIKSQLEALEVQDQLNLMRQLLAAMPVAPVGEHPLFDTSSSSTFPLHLYRMEAPREVGCHNVFETEVFFRGPAIRNAYDCICLYYVDDAGRPQTMRPRMGSVFYLSERRAASATSCVPPSLRSSETPDELRLGWDSMTVTLKLNSLPMSTYRFVYFDAVRQQVMAATDIITLKMQHFPPPVAAARAPALAPTTMARQRSSGTGSTSGLLGSQSSATSVGSSLLSYLPSLPAWVTGSSTTSSSSAAPVALHPSFLALSGPDMLEKYEQAPPAFFRSHFTLNASAVHLALQLDRGLESLRDRLVPSRMTQDEFFLRYFWLMGKLSEEEITEYPAATIAEKTTEMEVVPTAPLAQVLPPRAPAEMPSHTPTPPPASSSSSYAPPTSSYVPPALTAVSVEPSAAANATTVPAYSPPSAAAAVAALAPLPASPAAPLSTSPAIASSSSPIRIVSSPAAPVVTVATASRLTGGRPIRSSRGGDLDDEEDADSTYVPPTFSAPPPQTDANEEATTPAAAE